MIAVFPEGFGTNHFRGISNLAIESPSHANIIAGDNDCGKTSVLGALLLLRSPLDVTNVLRIACMGDINIAYNGSSAYGSFVNLFPADGLPMETGLYTRLNNRNVSYQLIGEKKTIMLDSMERDKFNYPSSKGDWEVKGEPEPVETEAFSGKILFGDGKSETQTEVELHTYTRVSGIEIKRNQYVNMIYLAPMDHVHGNVLGCILRNKDYKEICIQTLKSFDSGMEDLLILKNEDNNRPVECVSHKTLGIMPLSTYGDGIKEVLSLANGITQTSGGVLLIDEIETTIHSGCYGEIFGFLVKTCMTFRVQTFVTTHSIETIDGLPATQDYEKQGESDFIHVITLKKEAKGQKTHSRVLTGREVYTSREEFGFEVRL